MVLATSFFYNKSSVIACILYDEQMFMHDLQTKILTKYKNEWKMNNNKKEW